MENRISPLPPAVSPSAPARPLASQTNLGTLLLTRSDVAGLLRMPECIDAVEKAFRLREAGFDAKYLKGGHAGWKAIGGAIKLHA